MQGTVCSGSDNIKQRTRAAECKGQYTVAVIILNSEQELQNARDSIQWQ